MAVTDINCGRHGLSRGHHKNAAYCPTSASNLFFDKISANSPLLDSTGHTAVWCTCPQETVLCTDLYQCTALQASIEVTSPASMKNERMPLLYMQNVGFSTK